MVHDGEFQPRYADWGAVNLPASFSAGDLSAKRYTDPVTPEDDELNVLVGLASSESVSK